MRRQVYSCIFIIEWKTQWIPFVLIGCDCVGVGRRITLSSKRYSFCPVALLVVQNGVDHLERRNIFHLLLRLCLPLYWRLGRRLLYRCFLHFHVYHDVIRLDHTLHHDHHGYHVKDRRYYRNCYRFIHRRWWSFIHLG